MNNIEINCSTVEIDDDRMVLWKALRKFLEENFDCERCKLALDQYSQKLQDSMIIGGRLWESDCDRPLTIQFNCFRDRRSDVIRVDLTNEGQFSDCFRDTLGSFDEVEFE